MPKDFNILVIDDCIDDCMTYERICKKIEEVNYHVSSCHSGEEGIAYLRNHHVPDCILLDYSLPGRNGIAVMHDIRSEYPSLPVIILTGQGSEAIAVDVMKAGAKDYIIKSSVNVASMKRLLHNTIAQCAMQNKIEEQRKSLALFARAMAHDLKEPIRSINSFSGLIKKSGTLDNKNMKYMEFITNSAAHMENLMQNVAHYTKLDAMIDPVPERVIMDDCAKQTLINLQPLIDEYHAIVTIDALPVIMGFPSQIVQLLQNLIGNAIRYCPNNRTPAIHVSALQEAENWVVSVKDNGDGIDKQFRQQIFMPFKRLVGQKIPGTGLGLAISKKIIELHHGKLWHYNADNGGSVFAFSLPASSDTATAVIADITEKHHEKHSATWLIDDVLLVEDNPLDVELAQLLLLEEQHDINFVMHTVPSAERALHWLQTPSNPKVDLILLDINMPGMNGLELLSILKSDATLKHIPVSMLSTSSDEEDIHTALTLGACDYMNKPPSFDHFINIIQKLSA